MAGSAGFQKTCYLRFNSSDNLIVAETSFANKTCSPVSRLQLMGVMSSLRVPVIPGVALLKDVLKET